ncbi:polymorphic toxin type 44 domain-containing protein, partial [Clostridium sporogenes]
NPQNYRIGIYAPRHICTLVAEKGYSCSSFVCDMSSGFSGNLGYPLPKDWAFDQISTVTVGSGSGAIEIDNNICSNKYTGVSSMDGKPKDITKELTNLMVRYEYIYGAEWTGKSTILDLYTFYELVRNKGTLDLKNQGWTDSVYIFNGEIIPGDAPGNILYGYMGKAFGYSDELLLRAAGYAQVKAGTSKPEWGHWSGSEPYGDDPRDQSFIKKGISYYKNLH